MTAPITVTVEPAPVFDVDPAMIGRALMYLTAQSANLGHSRPVHTLHYGAEDTSTEGGQAAQFVRDVLTLPTAEICEKWFGSRSNASRYATGVFGAMLAQHRKPEHRR